MAVATIALREDLRPWSHAGVSHLLVDEVIEAWLAQAESHSPEQKPHQPPQPYQKTHSPQAPQVDTARACNVCSAPTTQLRGRGASPPHTPAPPQACSPAKVSSLPLTADSREPTHWPAAWQDAWQKLSPPMPVVWTYWSLGADMGGAPSAQRATLLRQIIGSLHLPKGTIAFWPVAMPAAAQDTTSLIADPGLFLAGIKRLNPEQIITFGSKALHTFAPQCALRPYQFTHFEGARLYAMPDIDYLLEASGPLDAVISCLRVALQHVRT